VKPRPPLPEGPFVVVGLARSGVAAALALRGRGETVIGCDDGPAEDPALAQAAGRLAAAGVELHLDASREATAVLTGAGMLIKSPGVPRHAPLVAAALERGIPVIGELELAWRLLPNEFLAVTGTNGKTTTSEWIGHIHRRAGVPVAVAGNVGTPLSALVGEIGAQATIVCEASSFQLEDTVAFSPEAAVLVNLSADHLDRHRTFEAYVAAKLRAFANQGGDDIAVVPADFGIARLGGGARRVLFGGGSGAALCERSGWLWWREEPLIETDRIALPGAHNRQNAMAAAAACLARGLDREAVAVGLTDFPGVPHRLERVGTIGGVRWVNDSKATNVTSTLVALEALEGPIHLIAGGRGKGQDFAPLAAGVAKHCAAVYLIGEAADQLAAALGPTGVALRRCGDLEHAVAAARAAARPGETVLLSPACASYDQYPDFEARGEHFRALVEDRRAVGRERR
jgi:UDP-N-acetylmuramoylalanine--D-glutamate ligase